MFTSLPSPSLVRIALLGILFLPHNAHGEDLKQESFGVHGLSGCPVNEIVSNSDGTFHAVACQSVRGIYYSVDAGQTWKYSPGSFKNSATSVVSLEIVNDTLYTTLFHSVIYAALPKTAAEKANWEPVWKGTNIGPFSIQMHGSGQFLLVDESRRIDESNPLNTTPSIKVFDTKTNSVVATSTLTSPATAVQASATKVYHVTPGKFLRAPFDSQTGQIGAWEDITAQATTQGAVEVLNVYVVPNSSKLFIVVDGSKLRLSQDNGDSFQDVPGGPIVRNYRGRANFVGNTYVIANLLSKDGGATWIDLASDVVNGSSNTKLNGMAISLNPLDPNQALVSSDVGVLKSSNFLSDNRSWDPSSTGLQGIESLSIARSPRDPNIAVVGTSAGLALTRNFSDKEPQWVYPICPSTGCSHYDTLAFSHAEPSILFASVYSESQAWFEIINIPGTGEAFEFRRRGTVAPLLGGGYDGRGFVQSYKFLPNTVILSEPSQGGILFVDATTGTTIRTALDNQRVSAFIALSPDLMFAGLGLRTLHPAAQDRGIYKSTDGGVTWSEMLDEQLSQLVFATDFAYDAVRDILYAGTQSDNYEQSYDPSLPKGTVLALPGANAGRSDWSAPKEPLMTSSNFGLDHVAVDETTGFIYAAAIGRIFVSKDNGVTWSLAYSTNPIDWVHFLLVDKLPFQAASVASGMGILPSSTRIIMGSGSGLSKLLNADVNLVCSLNLAKKCRNASGVKAGTKCGLTAKLLEADTNAPLASTSLSLQRWLARKKTWAPVSSGITSLKGASTFSIKAKRRAQYRVESDDLACRSNTVKVKVRR